MTEDDERKMVEGEFPPLTKEDVLNNLQNMIDSYEGLPGSAMGTYATQYDLLSMYLMMRALYTTKD